MSYFSKKQKLSNQYDNSTRSNLNVFVRNFEHVDGNWPSHVYMNILKGLNPIGIVVYSD